MKRLYVVIVLIAISLALGLSTGFDLLYRLAYLLAFILAASFIWTRLSLQKLEVKVNRPPSRAKVGESIEERISVQNYTGLPKPLIEVEDLSNMPGHFTGRILSMRPRGFVTWKVSTECKRRGVYTLGPVLARGGDLFGLFRWERRYGGSQTIVVYPRVHDLPRFAIPAAELRGDVSLRQRDPFVTPHASTVREYYYSDTMNRIHWPSTARIGQLMVKEFDHGQSSKVWVFLDLHKYVQAGEGEESTDEYAVTIAASVAKKYLEKGYPVGLVAYGDRKYLLPTDTGQGQMVRIMEFLATVRAEGDLPLEEALPKEENLFSRYGSLVLITPSCDQKWTPALGALVRRQVKVSAILIDPSTFGGRHSNLEVLGALAVSGVSAYVVNQGDDIPTALSHTHRSPDAPEPVLAQRGGLL